MRAEEGVPGRDVLFEETGHLGYGDAEEEQAIGVELTTVESGDLMEAADAGFAEAENAVEAEIAVVGLGFKVRDYLDAEGDALARVAGITLRVAAGGARDGGAV